MMINRIYYQLKPFIPRSLQIVLRRGLVLGKRKLNNHIWPIDERAGAKPDEWTGWPDQKKFAFVLMHDVDTERGQRNCRELMRLDEDMGFRSLFNFVPERYSVSPELRDDLVTRGFEVGVHGLKHDGKLFLSRDIWLQNADRINRYLHEWKSVGFVSPSMHRNLGWMHDLKIEYDASTFDTDPFEPQPAGITTIFPFMVHGNNGQRGYIELPYTLSQDFTLFILMGEKNIDIWKQKLDWIAEKGGMALVITHPDYMNFRNDQCNIDEYPVGYYKDLLDYVKSKYEGQYWHALPRDVACFWREQAKKENKNNTVNQYLRPERDR